MRQWWVEHHLRRFWLLPTRAVGARCHSSGAATDTVSSIFFVPTRWRNFLTIILTVGTISFVHAGERLEALDVTGKRPAGLYRSVSQLNPTVCQAVLDSLNKEFSISDDRLEAYPRVAAASDLLLMSDLQLPWSRRLVRQPNAESYKIGSIDFSSVELDRQRVILYRRSFEISGPAIGDLPVNSLTISRARLPATSADQPIDPRVLKRVGGQQIFINDQEFETSNRPTKTAASRNRQSEQSRAGPYLLNVVAFGDALYVLAIDAVEAGIAAPRAADGSVNLYVLQLHSATNLQLVCHFVGR
jgi:hypothetical protein